MSAAAPFTPSFTIASPLCTNQTTTLTANTGTASVSGYTWTASPAGPVFGTPNASVTTVTFPSAGTFSVTLAATSGTMTEMVSRTTTVSVCAGINSLNGSDNAYHVFPNPSSDKLYIQASQNVHDINIEITDALGKVLLSQKPNFDSDNSAYLVNVNSMPAGIYFIKISSGKESSIKRFVKQ